MTSMPPPEITLRRVAIVGTGLIGTSIAMAASRAGATVTGWDLDPVVLATAAAHSGLGLAASLEAAVADADLVVVATPIAAVAASVAAVLRLAPTALVTDAASVKTAVIDNVRAAVGSENSSGSSSNWIWIS